ncbi:glycosyltransferase [Mucilaginibacter agri]|uniref:Glycosyltransferase n=1 Tax=Mucilaginibacter agri TaxID=2695265 RepID=A0A965ZCB0_9SPHI|nr:glycosyltransferase [Mucilaginibacter agri]NCD68389.1 glycosyltransferase [Mucilaginibacter agri]
MRIFFFTHPSFLGSQSMPRFANMLADGMQKRGHAVKVLMPEARFFKLPVPQSLKKWMGYIDQYILFPMLVRKLKKESGKETLFVFTDHALGPWIPLVADRPHVIHCHDFLAQRSALNEIPENPTSASGKKYQAYIRRGYQRGKNFISVSQKTQYDLHRFLKAAPQISDMVYNGLNPSFVLQDVNTAREVIGKHINVDLSKGYILHVGGNQWYKNRMGVIEIYDAWCKKYGGGIPLLMFGPEANVKLATKREASPYKNDIYLLSGKDDAFVKQAYTGASLFLFPSLAEGFGWPIAEAMASGAPVITTGEAPMNEVGGNAAFYISRRPSANVGDWDNESAKVLDKVLNLDVESRKEIIDAGLENVNRFNLQTAIQQIEAIYQKIVDGCTK